MNFVERLYQLMEFFPTKMEINMKDNSMRLSGFGVDLVAVDTDDTEFILSLRVNPLLNQHLSYVDNSFEKQYQWLAEYKKKELAGLEYYFIYMEGDNKWGTIRLYYIDKEKSTFTAGSWIKVPGAPKNIAKKAYYVILDYAFLTLGLQEHHFDIRKGNQRVIEFHEYTGGVFVSEGELDYFYMMDRDTYLQNRSRLLKDVGIEV